MKIRLLLLVVFVVTVFAFVSCQTQTPSVKREIIKTADAPAAIGPYSQGVKVGDMLFCSGQIAIDPQTNQIVTGDIEAQTRRVLDNLGAVLKAAGMSFSDVVRATVFLADMNDYAKMNSVYAEYFGESPPARCAVEVARVPKDVGVEIAVVALKAD